MPFGINLSLWGTFACETCFVLPNLALIWEIRGEAIPTRPQQAGGCILYVDKDTATELIPIKDVFVTDLYSIEDVGGGNLRFTFYAWQRSTIFRDRRREKVIVARIVMPLEAVKTACAITTMAAAGVQGIIHGVPVEKIEGSLN
jgi:hypothetical protein